MKLLCSFLLDLSSSELPAHRFILFTLDAHLCIYLRMFVFFTFQRSNEHRRTAAHLPREDAEIGGTLMDAAEWHTHTHTHFTTALLVCVCVCVSLNRHTATLEESERPCNNPFSPPRIDALCVTAL